MLENIVVALLVLGSVVFLIVRFARIWRAATSADDKNDFCSDCSSCSRCAGCAGRFDPPDEQNSKEKR